MKNLLPYLLALFLLPGLISSCNYFSGGDSSSSEAISLETTSDTISMVDRDRELEIPPEAIRDQLDQKESAALREFYGKRDHVAAWKDPRLRTAFLEELQKADAEGLSLKDYYSGQLKELLEALPDLDQTETAQLDLLLTTSFLTYAHDLYYGRLNPRELYEHWGVKRKKKDFTNLLQESLEEGTVTEALNSLKPPHQIYRDLKAGLQEYAALRKKENASPKIEEGNFIRIGERDSRLPAVAKRLQELGMLEKEVTDSIYSEDLQEAVKQFQKDRGLEVDGIIGNSTIAELNMTAEHRYRQILANLERWRWYPRDLGDHYILINIPQFKLAVVKDGDTVRTHNIIAGTRSRQTPVFTDTLQYVVVNPTWTIPPTIKSKDIIPKVRKDPSYLASKNMKVYDRESKLLNPSKVDWSNPEVNSYIFVQRAGPSNPLGQVKIIYPNRYLIYLHDTPAQNLFHQNQRAESSGCVRVENAVDLSSYVLQSDEEWNEEKIRRAIASGRTQQAKINRPIQVHHFYWTAWRAGGKTVFTEDVYRLDKGVYNRLLGTD